MIVKRLRHTLAIGTTLLALLGTARAEELKANASIALHSGQVAGTGFTVVDNPVVQGSLDITKNPLALGAWFDYDLKRENVNEFDFTARVELGDYAGIHTQLYGGYFTFPGLQLPDAQEVGLTLSTTTLPVDISLYGAKIFGDASGKGGYASLTIGKSYPLTDAIRVNASVMAGFNHHYFTESTGISHGSVDLSVPVSLGGFTITPAVKFLKTDPGHRFPGVFKDQIGGGITIGTEF